MSGVTDDEGLAVQSGPRTTVQGFALIHEVLDPVAGFVLHHGSSSGLHLASTHTVLPRLVLEKTSILLSS